MLLVVLYCLSFCLALWCRVLVSGHSITSYYTSVLTLCVTLSASSFRFHSISSSSDIVGLPTLAYNRYSPLIRCDHTPRLHPVHLHYHFFSLSLLLTSTSAAFSLPHQASALSHFASISITRPCHRRLKVYYATHSTEHTTSTHSPRHLHTPLSCLSPLIPPNMLLNSSPFTQHLHWLLQTYINASSRLLHCFTPCPNRLRV